MQTFTQLGVASGLRLSEARALTWEDVKEEAGLIRVKGKGGHERYVPIFDLAAEALNRLSRNGDVILSREDLPAYRKDTVSHKFKKGVRALRLNDRYHPHTLRHTFASWLAMEGVPPYFIRDWMGHSTITVTEVYAHLAPMGKMKASEDPFYLAPRKMRRFGWN